MHHHHSPQGFSFSSQPQFTFTAPIKGTEKFCPCIRGGNSFKSSREKSPFIDTRNREEGNRPTALWKIYVHKLHTNTAKALLGSAQGIAQRAFPLCPTASSPALPEPAAFSPAPRFPSTAFPRTLESFTTLRQSKKWQSLQAGKWDMALAALERFKGENMLHSPR